MSLDLSSNPLAYLYNYKGVYWRWAGSSGHDWTLATGGGSITFTDGELILTTASPLNSTTQALRSTDKDLMLNTLTWGKNRDMKCRVYFAQITTQIVYFTTGGTGTEAHIGFKIVDASVYGSCADGTTESLTGILYTLPSVAQYVKLEAVLIAGNRVDFYIDGVFKGSLATNLPIAASTLPSILFDAYIKTTAAVARSISVGEIIFHQYP